MKKRTFIKGQALVGSVLLASSLLSGCVGPFSPPAALYGPPPDAERPARRTPAPSFDPADNYGEDGYGPPIFRETPSPAPSFDPEDNLPAPVYGPAPDYDPDFDPALNEPETVYGPPSMFGFEDEEDQPVEEEEPPVQEGETQG